MGHVVELLTLETTFAVSAASQEEALAWYNSFQQAIEADMAATQQNKGTMTSLMPVPHRIVAAACVS